MAKQQEPTLAAAEQTTSAASEYKRLAQEGVCYTLPGCGLVARLRRPSMHALMLAGGKVPNPLSREVLKFLASAASNKTDNEDAQIAAHQEHAMAIIRITALAMAEPTLVLDREPDYDRGEIGPGDLADEDYAWIYYVFISGRAGDAAAFRVKPDAEGAAHR